MNGEGDEKEGRKEGDKNAREKEKWIVQEKRWQFWGLVNLPFFFCFLNVYYWHKRRKKLNLKTEDKFWSEIIFFGSNSFSQLKYPIWIFTYPSMPCFPQIGMICHVLMNIRERVINITNGKNKKSLFNNLMDDFEVPTPI